MNYLEIVLGDFVLLEKNNLTVSFSTMLFSAIVGAAIAYPITLFAGKIFATYYHKLNYEKLTISVILFLFILVFLFSGPIGIFVMLISTSIGISSQLLGVRRVHLMGCIAIPVIIFYLF
jgi:putative membrane protein